jgi:hypothetical protein
MAIGGRKVGSNKGIAKQHKQNKRAAAEARQELRDSRSTEFHLSILDDRPGNSARERARLSGTT